MPIYEFTCKSCGKRFEELIRSSDSDGIACCHCDSHDVERIISSFSFKSDSGNTPASAGASSCGSCSKSSCSSCG
ncbi:zinc ribbon domain protein [bacterium BMS3Abin01]|nr:zinc ribbon domain protein [bacterium BMS3Abin01]HDZ59417.1 zinc ribbon domain-containing protein [Actinomycetota bacterium]